MKSTEKSHHSIISASGRIMMADLHMPIDQDPSSFVVYAHGINGFKDWGGMDLIAQSFAIGGHAFFKFNFSHNGTTPENLDEFVDLDAYGKDNYRLRQADLAAVIDYISAQFKSSMLSDVTLIGHSRGGTDAILYARKDNRISRLITWAAVAEAKTPWRNWNREQIEEWQQSGVRYLTNSRTGQDLPIYYQLYEEYQAHAKTLDVEQAARAIKQPWLITHGIEDDSVFIKDAYALKEWQPDAEVAIIKETGHTFGRSHPWTKNHLPKPTEALLHHSIKFIEHS